jgi:hypothetical protein
MARSSDPPLALRDTDETWQAVDEIGAVNPAPKRLDEGIGSVSEQQRRRAGDPLTRGSRLSQARPGGQRTVSVVCVVMR